MPQRRKMNYKCRWRFSHHTSCNSFQSLHLSIYPANDQEKEELAENNNVENSPKLCYLSELPSENNALIPF